jgi:putative transposase
VDRGQCSLIADNEHNRRFNANAPNQKWVADFTYTWMAQGWLYVAVVLDLYSRRSVGWSMQSSMTSQLVADALMMAVWCWGKPEEVLRHADQVSQYTSELFKKLLAEQGITCSMSPAGVVWDNSTMDQFVAMTFAHQTYRESFGDINVATLGCHPSRLHLPPTAAFKP